MKVVYLVKGSIIHECTDTLAVFGNRESAYKFIDEYEERIEAERKAETFDVIEYDNFVVETYEVLN